nr:hypothetical protein 3 [bacterium]
MCKGGDWTNEPPGINYYGPPSNTEVLDKLWLESVVSRENHLVLKAPGYCFAWPYFSNLKEYECKYIYCRRPWYEVADSMIRHEGSRHVFGLDLVSTSCPRHRLEEFEPTWKTASEINKAALRYIWHISEIPPEMVKASLRMEYHMRTDPKWSNDALMNYLGIPHSDAMLEELGNFKARKIEPDEYQHMLLGGLRVRLEVL